MSNTVSVSNAQVEGGKDPKKFFARLYKGEKLPAAKQFQGLRPSNGHLAEELICDCCGDGNDCCGFN